jgi:alkylhydroperoxidase/carboxymuconolactone decarboxylase family protein YurZ
MDSKTEVMVALGAALGVNCIPCFDHLYTRSKEVGLTDEDIRRICRIADKVKGGAAMFIKQAVIDVAGEPTDASEPCSCPTGGGCC